MGPSRFLSTERTPPPGDVRCALVRPLGRPRTTTGMARASRAALRAFWAGPASRAT